MWWLVCGVAGILGLVGGLVVLPATSVVALAISLSICGALMAVGCRLSFGSWPEADTGRIVVRSAGLGVVVAFGAFLPFLVLGKAWFVGLVLLGTTSPPVVGWCRSRWHRPEFGADSSGADAELWAVWAASGRELAHPRSVDDALLLVEVRGQVLDELVARCGSIPGRLWPAS